MRIVLLLRVLASAIVVANILRPHFLVVTITLRVLLALSLIYWWIDQAFLDAISEYKHDDVNLLQEFWKMFGQSCALLFPEELTGPVLVTKNVSTVLYQFKTLYGLGDCGKKLFGPFLSRGSRLNMNKFLRGLLEPPKIKAIINEDDDRKVQQMCDAEIEAKQLSKHVDGIQNYKLRYRGQVQEHEATVWNEIRDCQLEGHHVISILYAAGLVFPWCAAMCASCQNGSACDSSIGAWRFWFRASGTNLNKFDNVANGWTVHAHIPWARILVGLSVRSIM